MSSGIKWLLAAVVLSFTASAAQADQLETSIRKSAAPRPAVEARSASAVPTTTDEARAQLIRQEAASEARGGGAVVRHVPKLPTTTDEARSEAIFSQAAIAARVEFSGPRRVVKRGYPTTTDEARGLY